MPDTYNTYDDGNDTPQTEYNSTTSLISQNAPTDKQNARNKSNNKSNNPSQNDKKKSLWQRWKRIDISARSQIILAILTFLTLVTYVIISIHQSNLTRDAIAESAISNFYTKQSLLKTQKAIALQEESLKHSVKTDYDNGILAIKDTLASDRNTKMELRAYLAIDSMKIRNITINGIELILKIMNTGKTPAYNIVLVFAGKPDGTGIYKKEMDELIKHRSDTNAEMHGNGMSFTLEYTLHLGDNPIVNQQIISGEKDFYIYGIIFYDDIFKIRHRTRFCYRFYNMPPLGCKYITYKYYNDGD